MKIILSTIILLQFTMLHAQSTDQGNQQLYYERFQSAERTFHQVIQQQPENGQAWYGLIRAYLQEGKSEEAVDTIRMAPQSAKDDPFYQAAYGYLLLNENKKDSAATLFNNALDQTRHKNADVLAAVARANIETKYGDANYAIDLLNRAIKRDKHNPRLNVLKGDAYRKLNNGSEAYKSYQRAIQKDKKLAAAYHKTGEIFLSQKNPDLYLQYFTKAIAADPQYAPSLYKLYTYEFYHDPTKAKQIYEKYIANADATIQNEYDMADLLYLNKEYNDAITKGKALLTSQGPMVQPRIYKLIGYSYAGLEDTMHAITFMKQYLDKEADSNIISKDYAALATFYSAMDDDDSLATVYFEKAIDREKDSAELYGYFKKLANLAKAEKDYAAQAKWLGRYYNGNNAANNLNLFNWGLAHFRAGDYEKSDSVFGLYMAIS